MIRLISIRRWIDEFDMDQYVDPIDLWYCFLQLVFIVSASHPRWAKFFFKKEYR